MDVNKSARSVSVASPIILINGVKRLLVIEKQYTRRNHHIHGSFWVFHMKYSDNYSS